ncbi:hypothetical protein AVEN_265767-1 [Araneus ventricosus]|uniref:Uncharacterized protein n=1 Tax=Araneus ventricosus TaxID=182803 RepID=A0A4Y2SAJ5_ARAVE|nr:hypothetical protein AVEN_265767-1 [Araneus ventricosus]
MFQSQEPKFFIYESRLPQPGPLSTTSLENPVQSPSTLSSTSTASLNNPDQSLSTTGASSSSKAHQQIVQEESVPGSKRRELASSHKAETSTTLQSSESSVSSPSTSVPATNLHEMGEFQSPSRALLSPVVSRTPSPKLPSSNSWVHLNNPLPVDETLPQVDLYHTSFSPSTSDIEGAIAEMSPLIQHHMVQESEKSEEEEDEEELKILYKTIKIHSCKFPLNPDCIEAKVLSPEKIFSFFALTTAIRTALSLRSPNLSQEMFTLDNIEEILLAIEPSKEKPKPSCPTKNSEIQTVHEEHPASQQVSNSSFSHQSLFHPEAQDHIASLRPLHNIPGASHSFHQKCQDFPNTEPTLNRHLVKVPFPSSNCQSIPHLQQEMSSISPPQNSSVFTILLYPTSNSNLTLPDLLSETITSKDFNPVEIKLIRGNGLAVTLQSQEDIVKLTSKIEANSILNSAITPKFPGKRNPSIIIYNIPSTINEEAIQEALKSQFHLYNTLNARYNFKGSSPNTTNWVFEASATILNTILQSNKILIGWRMFWLSEFYHLKRRKFFRPLAIPQRIAPMKFHPEVPAQAITHHPSASLP